MSLHEMPNAKRRVTATWLCVAAFFAGTASATPIPPAQFTYDVTQGGSLLAGCSPAGGTTTGGTCGSEASGPGYAATSGGIGSPSYLPALGPGTAVDATSTWTAGGKSVSNALLTYSFEATGPNNIDLIPVDVLSKGLLAASGDAWASLSMTIWDSGPDGNIPGGLRDQDPPGPLLQLTAICSNGSCFSDWSAPGNEVTDTLCVVNGDTYTITIDAMTSAAGANSDASALLDPEIKVDPPPPVSCPAPVNLNAFGIDVGPGASSGYAVPEPSTSDLAAIGLLALGCLGVGRRFRAKLKAAGRSS